MPPATVRHAHSPQAPVMTYQLKFELAGIVPYDLYLFEAYHNHDHLPRNRPDRIRLYAADIFQQLLATSAADPEEQLNYALELDRSYGFNCSDETIDLLRLYLLQLGHPVEIQGSINNQPKLDQWHEFSPLPVLSFRHLEVFWDFMTHQTVPHDTHEITLTGLWTTQLLKGLLDQTPADEFWTFGVPENTRDDYSQAAITHYRQLGWEVELHAGLLTVARPPDV